MERADAVQIFKSAVAAVHPAKLIREHLTVKEDAIEICGHVLLQKEIKNIYIVGAGKAAAAMSVAIESLLHERISGGVVVTKYGHALPTSYIKVLEGAHPVPDENCIAAVSQTMQLLKKATKDDLIICLISGGASALWCDVPPGATLSDIQNTFELLIKSGAAIHEINTVRKHLSGIKGGQLLRHCGGARVCSLIISDVPGDNLEVIASGPTVADASTFEGAYDILSQYNLLPLLPASIRLHIEKGVEGVIPETIKVNDPLLARSVNNIIGNNQVALLAAEKRAKALGYQTFALPALETGDAAAAAKAQVSFAAAYTGPRPVCILQGAETTVRVTSNGKGGRNQHYVLAALHELSKKGHKELAGAITILSAGTDGTDGPTDAAGGIADSHTLNKAEQKKLAIQEYLNNQDAYHFLEQTDSLLTTGPTQTNVMDLIVTIVK